MLDHEEIGGGELPDRLIDALSERIGTATELALDLLVTERQRIDQSLPLHRGIVQARQPFVHTWVPDDLALPETVVLDVARDQLLACDELLVLVHELPVSLLPRLARQS